MTVDQVLAVAIVALCWVHVRRWNAGRGYEVTGWTIVVITALLTVISILRAYYGA